jgi:sterol desaturase/sphingolipid hydroxylase (fatty acid hydroxylase superfamily)
MNAQAAVMILPIKDDLKLSQEVVLAAFLLILLQVLDGILTHHGLNLHGSINGEGNMLLQQAMHNYGVIPALVMAKSLAVAFICALCVLSTRVYWIKSALHGLVAFYLVCAIFPWMGILLLQ